MQHTSDTIAAIATAPGRAGVAVVRVSGPDAFAVARALAGRAVSAADAGRFFHARFVCPRTGAPLDDGLLLVFAAPRSYTGEDVVEFQTHGGSVAPRRVLDACFAAGARLARRGEFTERAFLNGRLGLDAAEAVIDLIDAKTDRAAADARARLDGARTRAHERLYETALDLSGRAEHALDFSEDELPPGYADDLRRAADDLRAGIDAVLARAREGKLLRDGACVVLAGAPNAGKSSLLNALLGEHRAIVSGEAGTTRDSIEEWMDLGGWPVRLTDTAGLRETDNAVEAEGVARARDLIAAADLVVALDCDIPGALRVHAKCDLARAADTLNVSARTGEGLDDLKRAIVARLEQRAAERTESDTADLSARQRPYLERARAALENLDVSDLVLAANALRAATEALAGLVGKHYSSDLLDTLFSRFCIGK